MKSNLSRCSQDVAGMLLGCIYMMASTFGFVYHFFSWVAEELRKNPESRYFFKTEEFELLLYVAIATFVSYLFTVAIEERRRYLVLPWLFYNLYTFYMTVEAAYLIGISYLKVLIFILMFALEILIICNSCCLFMKMRREHLKEIERFEQQLTYTV